MNRTAAILQTKELSKRFGALLAVDLLELNVNQGEIFGLVGPNGAGKSTAVNMIGGYYFPTKGRIIYCDHEITRLLPYQRCQRGITMVFQRNIFFSSFTVLDNVIAGFHLHSKMGIADIFVKRHATREHENDLRQQALEILKLVNLEKHANEMAKNMPYGNQRLLSIAIALATKAKMFLLDEPLTGMTAYEITFMIDIIKRLREEKGVTFIIVEHNMKAVVDLCDRIAVLDFGRKIAEGSPSEIMKNPHVIEAYLGR